MKSFFDSNKIGDIVKSIVSIFKEKDLNMAETALILGILIADSELRLKEVGVDPSIFRKKVITHADGINFILPSYTQRNDSMLAIIDETVALLDKLKSSGK